jgi:hypothetical protein
VGKPGSYEAIAAVFGVELAVTSRVRGS